MSRSTCLQHACNVILFILYRIIMYDVHARYDINNNIIDLKMMLACR